MGIKLGLVGLGTFGSIFAPLFKSHPLVSRIALCDREPERIARFAKDPLFQDKFKPSDAYETLDDICRADLDALVIITQPWLHAPQCIQANTFTPQFRLFVSRMETKFWIGATNWSRPLSAPGRITC